jgi:hypothetical protein
LPGARILLSFKNATGTIFVDVTAVIKFASTAISFAGSSLKQAVSAMSKGTAVCEEFCDTVESGVRILHKGDYATEEIEEIKCQLSSEYFTPLVERLVSIGYCCTQVQKDAGQYKCTAWIEPATPD